MTKEVAFCKAKNSFSNFLDSFGLSDNEFELLIERHKLGGIFTSLDSYHYKKFWVINELYISLLIQELSHGPSVAILLKGGHLLSRFYPKSGQRFMGDVDLLINSEYEEVWFNFLKGIGFEHYCEEKWEANEFKNVFQRQRGDVLLSVELHTRLFFEEKEGVTWPPNECYIGNLYFLNDNDLFIHLCGHLVSQHTFHSLNWLFDILLLLNLSDLNWNYIEERSKKVNVYKSCIIVFQVLKNHFEYKLVPSNFNKNLILKFFLTKRFLLEPYNSKFSFLIIKFFSKNKLTNSVDYFLGWTTSFFKK